MKLEDKYNGFSTRSTNSISGGESFLVSLALALALADFGQHLGVSTLFIDEGFGTLSGEPLQNAINTLRTLHSQVGRQVGIISHREELRENIPVQIKVNLPAGSSAAKIEIVSSGT
jgi:exonuclease SbcC